MVEFHSWTMQHLRWVHCRSYMVPLSTRGVMSMHLCNEFEAQLYPAHLLPIEDTIHPLHIPLVKGLNDCAGRHLGGRLAGIKDALQVLRVHVLHMVIAHLRMELPQTPSVEGYSSGHCPLILPGGIRIGDECTVTSVKVFYTG